MAGPLIVVPGSTPYFQSLVDDNLVFRPQNNFELFKRAIKVFYMSYPELDGSSPFHQQMFDDYCNAMRLLYIIPDAQLLNMHFLANIYQDVRNQAGTIVLNIKRFRGSNLLTNPRMIIRSGQNVVNQASLWEPQGDIHPHIPIVINMNFTEYRAFRSNPNFTLILSIEKDNPDPQLNNTVFTMANTHPEGYEDWFDFGSGVQLLIQFEYTVPNENNVDPTTAAEFHLNTILKMLEIRFYIHATRTEFTDTGHQLYARKYEMTYRRPYVTPNTNEMFWTQHPLGLTLGQPIALPYRRPTTVKYADLQRTIKCNEDFEDRVCLCSEWCNWNAFFYYNPIYRFLMVQHNQLFMTNPSNVPDMYLLSTIKLGSHPIPTRVPILRLMINANEYRRRYFYEYFLKRSSYRDQYSSSNPLPTIMLALAYNKLLNAFNIQKLSQELDDDPFSDVCIDGLMGYYKVLTDLHFFHTPNGVFVDDKKKWLQAIDSIGRLRYSNFVQDGYTKCLQSDLGGVDYMFTTDYEYAYAVSRSEEEEKIRRMRDTVVNQISTESPFNLKIFINDFLKTFASVYKFLSKVERNLPVAHKRHMIRENSECYTQMDSDFVTVHGGKNFFFNINITDSQYPYLEQNFYVFYTLKVYFYAFEIQSHCINAGIKNNDSYTQQVSQLYDFIWNKEVLEANYRYRYKSALFEDILDFDQSVDDFYDQFWGTFYHETVPVHSLGIYDCVSSGHGMHQQLYVWWGYDGDNRRKFTNILTRLTENLSRVTDCSNRVLNDWITPAMAVLIHEYFYEVFDHLVYYLVKAHCSVILDVIALLFRAMHSLQDTDLTNSSVSYTLAKPGWIPLFRTMNWVMDALDRVKTDFVSFEDEFERITNTFVQTQRMIKNIYQQLYAKLCHEWIDEVETMALTGPFAHANNVNRIFSKFIICHLAVGLSFLAAFMDVYRSQFWYYRKYMLKRFEDNPDPLILNNEEYGAITEILYTYLRDTNAIQNAKPYESSVWTTNQYLVVLKGELDQLTPTDVDIDLDDADQD